MSVARKPIAFWEGFFGFAHGYAAARILPVLLVQVVEILHCPQVIILSGSAVKVEVAFHGLDLRSVGFNAGLVAHMDSIALFHDKLRQTPILFVVFDSNVDVLWLA